ncbi:hypothetical protein V2J09_006803 [Rumex salicifolius]
MQRKTNPFDRKGEVLIHPPPFSPLPSFPYPETTNSTRQSSSSSVAKISPAILLVIIIAAIAFFVCGLLHLLFLSLDYSRQLSNDGSSLHSVLDKPAIMEEESEVLERRVYSVRLGKYRSSNLTNNEETSSRNLDARRCYSMGSCEYVIGDSDLLVSLTDGSEDDGTKLTRKRVQMGSLMVDGDVEAKRISNRGKGESFSVSKIWQWSKKSRFLSQTNVGNSGPFHLGLPLTNKVQDVEDSV